MTEETKTYTLDNGEPTSRAGYIRQEFQKDRSRKEIAEELDVKYNVVFSATANMFNAAHPEGGGGGKSSPIVEHPETKEQMPRKQAMEDLYANGWTRREIAAHFETSYGAVYSATKDIEPPEGSKAAHGGKVMITHPDTGEQVPRVDFIREKYAEGLARREIADLAGCDYSVVWMATREDKEEADEDVADEEDTF